jgi:outer membrane protein OmpA-like peptidoglycan-associated protein
MKLKFVVLSCVLQLGLGIITDASGEEPLTNLSGKKLSVQMIKEALLKKQTLQLRGACKDDPSLPAYMQCPKVPTPVSFDQITFEFNSAQLTSEAREVLAMIGAALATEQLEARNFEVEGHTDAKGGDAYNLALSKRRAESVKRYLTAVSKIDAERLEVVPMGKQDLLYPNDPENSKNRRVVFREISEE